MKKKRTIQMRKDAIEAKKLSESLEDQKKFLNIYMILFVLLIVLLTGVCYLEYEKNLTLDNKIEQIQKDIEIEKNKTESLNDMLKNHDSDEHVEKIAREQLGYVKPNEIIYIDRNSKSGN